jgi:hypothetical protein
MSSNTNRSENQKSDIDVPKVTTSPSDLLEHLIEMTDSLEKVWSAALNTTEAKTARQEAKGVWSSFAEGYANYLEMASGIDEELVQLNRKFPPEQEEVAQLTLEPSGPEERYRQLLIAAQYGLVDLLESVTGLEDPTGQTISFNGGVTIESWWQAGAFSLVRRRAMSLARVLRVLEQCIVELAELKNGDTSGIPESYAVKDPWFDSLRIAHDLISLGYSDLALVPLLRCLREVVGNATRLPSESLPTPLGKALDEIPSLAVFAQQVELLENSIDRLSKGQEIEYGVSVPLSRCLHDRLLELALDPIPQRSWEPLIRKQHG